MTALEKIREFEKDLKKYDPQPDALVPFLLKAFNVMREIAIYQSHDDDGPDEIWPTVIDEMFEKRMKDV